MGDSTKKQAPYVENTWEATLARKEAQILALTDKLNAARAAQTPQAKAAPEPSLGLLSLGFSFRHYRTRILPLSFAAGLLAVVVTLPLFLLFLKVNFLAGSASFNGFFMIGAGITALHMFGLCPQDALKNRKQQRIAAFKNSFFLLFGAACLLAGVPFMIGLILQSGAVFVGMGIMFLPFMMLHILCQKLSQSPRPKKTAKPA